MSFWSVLGAFWGRPGTFWGRSDEFWGRSRAFWGSSGPFCGLLWNVLNSVWNVLGLVWGRSVSFWDRSGTSWDRSARPNSSLTRAQRQIRARNKTSRDAILKPRVRARCPTPGGARALRALSRVPPFGARDARVALGWRSGGGGALPGGIHRFQNSPLSPPIEPN